MSRDIEINERSRIPLYILYGAIVATASLSIMATKIFFSIDKRLERIERHVSEDWSLHDQELWAYKLGRENPSIKVPDVIERRASTQSGMAATIP